MRAEQRPTLNGRVVTPGVLDEARLQLGHFHCPSEYRFNAVTQADSRHLPAGASSERVAE
mgnify:CR=1 FL=1